MGMNQGPSSTQDNVVKKMCYIPQTENLAGNESPQTTFATADQSSVAYNIKDVNQLNGTSQPYLNVDYSHEDRSKKWQNGVQEVPEAGRNQYQ